MSKLIMSRIHSLAEYAIKKECEEEQEEEEVGEGRKWRHGHTVPATSVGSFEVSMRW
jgi:hypothetical protein